MRYTQAEKMEIIRLVEESELPVKRILAELDVPRSTFYRWYDRYKVAGYEGLADRKAGPRQFWNRIPDAVREHVVQSLADPGGVITYPGKFRHRYDFRLWNTLAGWAMMSVMSINAISNQVTECLASVPVLDPFPPIQDVFIGVVEDLEGDHFELALVLFSLCHVSFSVRGYYRYDAWV
jgi:hypothetical protein